MKQAQEQQPEEQMVISRNSNLNVGVMIIMSKTCPASRVNKEPGQQTTKPLSPVLTCGTHEVLLASVHGDTRTIYGWQELSWGEGHMKGHMKLTIIHITDTIT